MPYFWGVQARVTLISHAFFAFRTVKKDKKGLDDHKIENLTMSS